MNIVGIDPGKHGAIACISPSYGVIKIPRVNWDPMPEDLNLLVASLEMLLDPENDSTHIFVEKAQSFPGGGVAGMFNYGVHFGEILGIVRALNIPHTLVPPRMWTRVMHVGTKDAEPKKRSLEACRRLFPDIKLTLTDRAKKPHDGAVDALLIAEYGRRLLKDK